LVESKGAGQKFEIQVVEILGDSDAEVPNTNKDKPSLDYLRENAHLRVRTNMFGALCGCVRFVIYCGYFQEKDLCM
jgi:asparaginyl-tRNA synthetase